MQAVEGQRPIQAHGRAQVFVKVSVVGPDSPVNSTWRVCRYLQEKKYYEVPYEGAAQPPKQVGISIPVGAQIRCPPTAHSDPCKPL